MLTISNIKSLITPVLQNYDVEKAFLFGSYARGDATETSDIDIRVDKGKSQKLKSLLDESSLYLDLKEALGQEIDLITCLPQNPISKYFVSNLKKDEVKIYDRAQERTN